LARPNAQRLIEHGSALMGRVDSVLGEAEASQTVQRTAEFLTTLRLVLGSLIEGGMHLEVGQPDGNNDNALYYDQDNDDDTSLERGPPNTGKQHPPQASLLKGLPRVVGYEPEQTRTRRKHRRKPQ